MDGENTENSGATLFSKVLFNIPRHNLITEAAYKLLSVKAKTKVDKILDQTGFPFPASGAWADLIKDSTPPNDPETVKFLADPRNNKKKHKKWHYVNLPLKSKSYQQAAQAGFTKPDDIVQTIKLCVLDLKAKTPTRFTHVTALRLVGHLVGDVHQPLHVGCGFVDDSTNPPTLVSDPAIIKNKKLKSDTGGNDILLPGAGNMHSFWDGSLSGDIGSISLLAAASATKKKQLIEKIYNGAKKLGAGSSAKTTMGLAAVVPVEDWAQEWANESLKVASKAYQNITIISPKQSNGYKVTWEGKEAYIKRCRPLVLKQMKSGARHLADLLNEIYK